MRSFAAPVGAHRHAPEHAPAAAGEKDSHRLAGLVCLAGFLLHLVFSQPLLEVMGLSTATEQGGNILKKIHPGSYAVFAAFFIYLWDRGNPLQQSLIILRQFPIHAALLALYIALAAYWLLRERSGVGLLFDTHMPLPMAAIILSTAPRKLCRRALACFIAMTLLNSAIGIIEAAGKFRIFTFPDDWVVLNEEYFRASALGGHPLNNAMLTPVAIFVMMALPFKALPRLAMLAVYMASLAAFGGRAGMGFSVIGLVVCGLYELRRQMKAGLSLRRLLMLLTLAAILPLMFVGGFGALLKSGIGERLAATSKLDDDSAQGRWLAFKVFDQMTDDEIILGISGDRVVDVAYRLGLKLPISDIENPWVLLLMQFGLIGFTLWAVTTCAFIARLLWRQPLPLQMAALIYFITASTSNSFGRKDSIYLIMVCAVVCAARVLAEPQIPDRGKTAPDAG